MFISENTALLKRHVFEKSSFRIEDTMKERNFAPIFRKINNFSYFLKLVSILKVFCSFYTISAEIIPRLTHEIGTTFRLEIPPTIKPKAAYLYNNTLNKINGEERRLIPLVYFETEAIQIDPITITIERTLSPNLYYGIEVTDWSNSSYFTNRYYFAHDDQFYSDKRDSPDRHVPDRPPLKEEKKFNWYLIPISIGVVFLIFGIVMAILYGVKLYLKKYKKNKNDSRQVVLE